MDGIIATLEGIEKILSLLNQIVEHHQALTINIIKNIFLTTPLLILVLFIKKKMKTNLNKIKIEDIDKKIKTLIEDYLIIKTFSLLSYALFSFLFIISLWYGPIFSEEGRKYLLSSCIMLFPFFCNIALANNEMRKVQLLEERRAQKK